MIEEKELGYPPPEEGIRDILNKIYKRRWFIFNFTFLCIVFALFFSFKVKPVYRAKTRILIESKIPKIVQFEDVYLTDYGNSDRYYNSQCEILKSNTIAKMVFDMLGDYKSWDIWHGRKKDATFTEEEKIKALLKNVKVKKSIRSQLVDILVEDTNPELAAKIANLWVRAYLNYIQQSRSSLTKYASTWLEKEIEKAKKKVEEAEQALQKYRKENNIIDDPATTSEDTALLNKLIERKAELETELAQQLNYFKEKHPIIKGLRVELNSINKKIKEERQRLLALKEKAIQYRILKREVETNKAIYESLLNRLKETKSIQDLRLTNIRIVDRATVPVKPVRPNKKMNFILALFIGLFLSTGAALLIENLDLSIKEPDEVQKYLGLPLLGTIPLYKQKKDKSAHPALSIFTNSHSPVLESYRMIKVNLTLSNPDLAKKLLLITSSAPNEGKSVFSVGLARIMAQGGEKVLLVDVDFRHPNLHEVFSVQRTHGLSDLLAEGIQDIHNYIKRTNVKNLDLLTCGSLPPDPAELLGAKKMEELIQELSKKYNRIIFDAPPVLAVTDALVLSTKVDGVIIIVRFEYTHRKALQKAKETLERVNAKILGAVLNMVNPRGSSYYYYYYYHYGEKI